MLDILWRKFKGQLHGNIYDHLKHNWKEKIYIPCIRYMYPHVRRGYIHTYTRCMKNLFWMEKFFWLENLPVISTTGHILVLNVNTRWTHRRLRGEINGHFWWLRNKERTAWVETHEVTSWWKLICCIRNIHDEVKSPSYVGFIIISWDNHT